MATVQQCTKGSGNFIPDPKSPNNGILVTSPPYTYHKRGAESLKRACEWFQAGMPSYIESKRGEFEWVYLEWKETDEKLKHMDTFFEYLFEQGIGSDYLTKADDTFIYWNAGSGRLALEYALYKTLPVTSDVYQSQSGVIPRHLIRKIARAMKINYD
jgi:hypothetical protein